MSQSNAGDVRELCTTLLNCYLIQLLETGFLHADPHTGRLIFAYAFRRDWQPGWQWLEWPKTAVAAMLVLRALLSWNATTPASRLVPPALKKCVWGLMCGKPNSELQTSCTCSSNFPWGALYSSCAIAWCDVESFYLTSGRQECLTSCKTSVAASCFG